MCDDYCNHVAYAEYAEAMRQLSMPIKAPIGPPQSGTPKRHLADRNRAYLTRDRQYLIMALSQNSTN